MIEDKKVKKILYGGDYNPEQWPKEIWEEDMRLFSLAKVDTVTVNVFSWALLQPSEDVYNFSQLDEIMEMTKKHQLNVCLATSTAAHPAWMATKYPDILRVEFDGKKRKFGGRHNSCPNSPTYKKYSVKLAKELAARYKDYDNIVAWHISNEYGGECYCENCAEAFREWLQKKYKTIENVNKAWNTTFWGHTFYAWDEIVPPNMLSEHFAHNRTMFQGISLDYARFNSDSMLERYKGEYEVLREFTPDIQITTNLMGFYKTLDYQKWGKYMDFISWDNYPSPGDSYSKAAMSHDLMRGLKGGKPFALMEQTPSVTNWQPYNALKRPGVMRLLSYQAVAHGADTVMFFQMRRSIGACEKFHGAFIDHAGHENTRVFRECAALGKELEQIGDKIIGSYTKSDVAILFDWDNWWAIEYSAGPSIDLQYIEQVMKYYEIFSEQNISVDIVGVDDSFSKYKLIIAPVMYMVKPGVKEKLKTFVKNGGTFVTTFFSGIVNENDLVTVGGYPGELRKLLGIWVEEIDALPPGVHNEFIQDEEVYQSELLCDIIHLEGAEAIAVYGKEFYAGTPAVTKNRFGNGEAWYIGSAPEKKYITKIVMEICRKHDIFPILTPQKNVEVTKREKDGKVYIFVLNHNEEKIAVTLDEAYTDILTNEHYRTGDKLTVEAKGVFILKKGKASRWN